MKKLKPLPKRIPLFSSYEEEAVFWETHNTSRLLARGKNIKFKVTRPVKHLISIRMDRTLLHGLNVMAAQKHIPYQTLIQSILAEKLQEWHRKSA
jgi:predicted DNA binding CopG/RHH family protein